jgi:hypothetical protein
MLLKKLILSEQGLAHDGLTSTLVAAAEAFQRVHPEKHFDSDNYQKFVAAQRETKSGEAGAPWTVSYA